jgi:endonuclease-3
MDAVQYRWIDPADARQRELLKDKAVLVHDRLCKQYDCPIPYFHSLDPLSELISSLLSHRTKNADSGRAYKTLKARFETWEQVRDAPTNAVQECIASVTWPELKAPRIQQVLREITRLRDDQLSLDFLSDWDEESAHRWLEQLPGVGPKTSNAVLSFSTLRRSALPVDSHHHRVAIRLALIPATLSVARSHQFLRDQLPGDWSPQQLYDNHQVMMRHGQKCCFHYKPDCPRCAVLDVCPTGAARLGERAPATPVDRDWKPQTKRSRSRRVAHKPPDDAVCSTDFRRRVRRATLARKLSKTFLSSREY